MPALLSVAASEGINLLRNTPSILATLQENVQAARAILDRLECIMIPSHPASPIIHIYIKHTSTTTTPTATATVSQREEWDFENEEKLLQDVVEEVLGQGVMITKAKRLREERMMSSSSSSSGGGGGQVRPSIRLAMTSALTKKEVEKAVGVVKNGLVKVLGKRR